MGAIAEVHRGLEHTREGEGKTSLGLEKRKENIENKIIIIVMAATFLFY